jgi:triacylglycerol lipase
MFAAAPLRRAAVVVTLCTSLAACGSITDPLSPGALAAAKGGKPKPPPPTLTHTPILFVHGWNASASTWTTMVGRFKADGWTSAELSTFSYNTAQSNATTAGIIKQKVDSIRTATGSAKVEIVTHSMGALSARYYVKNLGGEGSVDALVSLGGPNHGTTTAQLCFQTACQEMWPNSAFLAALNATDETPGGERYATWRSPCDEVINPHDSVILDAGPSGTVANTLTACMNHSQLHEDATVYAQVRDWVNQPFAALILAVTP